MIGGVLIFMGLCIQIANAYTRPQVNRLANKVEFLQDRNSIIGFVFNENRSPVADVYVELLDDLNVTIFRARTSGSGLYTFKGLANGQYNVKVLDYGGNYEGQTRAVSLVAFSAVPGRGAVNEQVDFYLKAKRNTNTGPLAAPGVIFVQEVPDKAKKLYESGIEDLLDKNENKGFDKLKQSLEIFPDYFLALDRLGREYVVRGYYQAAYVLLTKAVEVNPRSFSSTFGLGLASFRLQQVDQAINLLKRAVEIDNKLANGFLWLGIAYLQNKKFSQAEMSLNKANKLSKGESAEVHWQLARLYKDQNRFSESADSLELYLKYKSETAETEKIKETIKTLRQKAKSS
ncbi:MAG: tetratricopeptide repeat protein [Aridibacter sp.]